MWYYDVLETKGFILVLFVIVLCRVSLLSRIILLLCWRAQEVVAMWKVNLFCYMYMFLQHFCSYFRSQYVLNWLSSKYDKVMRRRILECFGALLVIDSASVLAIWIKPCFVAVSALSRVLKRMFTEMTADDISMLGVVNEMVVEGLLENGQPLDVILACIKVFLAALIRTILRVLGQVSGS